MNDLLPRMVDRDFTPRGFARRILKDIDMLGAAAKELHLAMPMASEATTLHQLLIMQGKGELDGAAVITLLEKQQASD